MRLPILLANIFDYPFTYIDKVFNSLKPGDFVKVMFGSKEETGVVWNFEQKMEKKIKSNGGEIKFNASVERIYHNHEVVESVIIKNDKSEEQRFNGDFFLCSAPLTELLELL